jgi:aspartate racemase
MLVIAGGVGPRAGIELHDKILKNTITDGDDQSHLDVLHVSYSSRINDRTGYLLREAEAAGSGGENPGDQLGAAVASAMLMLPPEEAAIIGVPCFTFHVTKIMDAFEARLSACGQRFRLIHLIDSVCAHLSADPLVRRVVVLATNGSIKAGTIEGRLLEHGLEVTLPDADVQALLHETIYNLTWGLKSKSRVTEKLYRRSRMAMRCFSAGEPGVMPESSWGRSRSAATSGCDFAAAAATPIAWQHAAASGQLRNMGDLFG